MKLSRAILKHFTDVRLDAKIEGLRSKGNRRPFSATPKLTEGDDGERRKPNVAHVDKGRVSLADVLGTGRRL